MTASVNNYIQRAPNKASWKWLMVLVALCAMSLEVAAAENRRLPKIGVLWSTDAETAAPYLKPFLEGIRALGWIDGQTAHFIVRYDGNDPSRFPALAAELVALGVDVLAVNNRALPAARRATTTVPIVCPEFFDPIAEGATSSLARPDGNITGVSWQSIDSAAKRLELGKDLIPSLRRVALLTDAGDPGAIIEAKGFSTGARRAGVRLRTFEVRQSRDFQAAFAAIRSDRPDALIVSTNPLTIENLDEIVRFASSMQLPTISEAPEFAERGFLLTYGPDIIETYKRGAVLVDRILRGAKPADLPFEQPTKFELAVNLKTAKALGLRIPELIMVRATRVIR